MRKRLTWLGREAHNFYMLSRLIRRLSRRRGSSGEVVHYLQIEPTTRCNFTCGFCIGRGMDQTDAPFGLFQKVLETFPELQHVQVQGEGEPLMHPRFFDVLALLRRHGARVSFITNGSWFTPDNVRRILDAGVHKILVSLESPDARTFQQIRGGKLDKVVRGIRALRAAQAERDTTAPSPSVGLALTILRQTRDHLPGVMRLYRELGLRGGICPQPLQKMETYREHYGPDMRAQLLNEAEIDLLKLRRKLDPRWRRILRERDGAGSFHEELFSAWRRGRRECPWLQRGLFINRKGQVSACCTMEDMGQYAFGTVWSSSRAELLAARGALRTALQQGVVPRPCQGCEVARLAQMTRAQTLRSLAQSAAGMAWHLITRPLAAAPGSRRPQPAAPAAHDSNAPARVIRLRVVS